MGVPTALRTVTPLGLWRRIRADGHELDRYRQKCTPTATPECSWAKRLKDAANRFSLVGS